MNKIERMAGILFLIDRKKKVQAREIAELFEISERTVYRDVQALMELQIPIISETGGAGGYSIAEGYFLRPIFLTEEESQALYLGCDFIRSQNGFPFSKAAERALRKLSALMSEKNLTALKTITDRILYDLPNTAGVKDSTLAVIKESIVRSKTVEIEYRSLKNELTKRTVDVYSLFYESRYWYIKAFCHLRKKIRIFKVARIERITLTDLDFEVIDIPEESPKNEEPKGSIVVSVKKGTILEKRVVENDYYRKFMEKEDKTHFYLHFPTEYISNDYMIEILLNLGKDAEVLSPESLRKEFLRELEILSTPYKMN